MIPSRIPWQNIDFSGGGVDPMGSLEGLLHGIMSDDTELQLTSTIPIKDLVNEHPHLLEEMLRRPDVVSRFVQFLAYNDFPQLKHEAAWVLAHMTTSDEDIQVLVDCGSVPLFVQLINADVEEERSRLAVWALGNLALESVERRDHVLSCGALMTLLSQCDVPNPTTTMLTAATEALRILCGVMPCPPLAQIQPALPVLKRFLQSENSDLLFLSSALLGCFFERGNNDGTRQALMDLGVIPRLMELLNQHESIEIHREVVRTIGAVLTSENRVHSQVVIDQKPILGIASYLNKAEDTNAKIAASCIVFRIAAWDQNQLEEVIASGVVQNMIHLLQDYDPLIEIWCVGTISRVTSEGKHVHISLLVKHGCIEALCNALTSPEQGIIPVALSALNDILGVAQDEENLVNPGRGGGSRYAKRILHAGGLEKINALKASEDENIKVKATNIVANYFNEDKKWW